MAYFMGLKHFIRHSISAHIRTMDNIQIPLGRHSRKYAFPRITMTMVVGLIR